MNSRLQIILASPEAAHRAGKTMGEAMPAGAICLFYGEMAAGKTTIIKGVCEGLGVDAENVISPTYTLVNIYPGRFSIFHVDLFRMETPEAILEMDRTDWINPAGVTLIEWPEKALPLLAEDNTLELRLSLSPLAVTTRNIALEGDTSLYGPIFGALKGL